MTTINPDGKFFIVLRYVFFSFFIFFMPPNGARKGMIERSKDRRIERSKDRKIERSKVGSINANEKKKKTKWLKTKHEPFALKWCSNDDIEDTEAEESWFSKFWENMSFDVGSDIWVALCRRPMARISCKKTGFYMKQTCIAEKSGIHRSKYPVHTWKLNWSFFYIDFIHNLSFVSSSWSIIKFWYLLLLKKPTLLCKTISLLQNTLLWYFA